MNDFSRIINVLIENQIVRDKSEFGKQIQISKQSLNNYKTSNRIPYSKLINFCVDNQISIDWLLTGKGEMFMREGKEVEHSNGEVSVAVCGDCGQRYGIEALITEKDKRLEEKDTLLIMLKKRSPG